MLVYSLYGIWLSFWSILWVDYVQIGVNLNHILLLWCWKIYMELLPSHKAILSRLLQGEAWKVVMNLIGERLVTYERQIRQMGLDRNLRHDLIERRNELLDIVTRLYRSAEEENPFDVAAGSIWATQMKLPEPPPKGDVLDLRGGQELDPYDQVRKEIAEDQAKRWRVRPRGGGVA